MPGKIQEGRIQTKSIGCGLFCCFWCCEPVYMIGIISILNCSVMEQTVLCRRDRKENDLLFLYCLLPPNIGEITCFREILLWSCCRSTWYKALMPSSIGMFSRRAVCCCSVISCDCQALSLSFSLLPWSLFTAFFFFVFYLSFLSIFFSNKIWTSFYLMFGPACNHRLEKGTRDQQLHCPATTFSLVSIKSAFFLFWN